MDIPGISASSCHKSSTTLAFVLTPLTCSFAKAYLSCAFRYKDTRFPVIILSSFQEGFVDSKVAAQRPDYLPTHAYYLAPTKILPTCPVICNRKQLMIHDYKTLKRLLFVFLKALLNNALALNSGGQKMRLE